MSAPKRPFMSGYRTYDPATEGYGSERQWRAEFQTTMGFEEAEEFFQQEKDKSPLGVLGLTGEPTWKEIKAAYRKLASIWHPDVNHAPDATERMKAINAAYVVLERQYGK